MNDENMLVRAIQSKSEETQKALDLFRQLHQQMHDEMDQTQKPNMPTVQLESSPEPS